jgi:DNA-binding LacI/PurR family transcriptional regulator
VDALAQRSVELLNSGIESDTAAVHEIVPAQLQWRESTKPIR